MDRERAVRGHRDPGRGRRSTTRSGVAIAVALLLVLRRHRRVRLRVRGRPGAQRPRRQRRRRQPLLPRRDRRPSRSGTSSSWMFLVCLAITAGTAAWEPFGVLVPMLPVGLAGVWAARLRHVPAASCRRASSARVMCDVAPWPTRRTSRSRWTRRPARLLRPSRPTSRSIPTGRSDVKQATVLARDDDGRGPRGRVPRRRPRSRRPLRPRLRLQRGARTRSRGRSWKATCCARSTGATRSPPTATAPSSTYDLRVDLAVPMPGLREAAGVGHDHRRPRSRTSSGWRKRGDAMNDADTEPHPDAVDFDAVGTRGTPAAAAVGARERDHRAARRGARGARHAARGRRRAARRRRRR